MLLGIFSCIFSLSAFILILLILLTAFGDVLCLGRLRGNWTLSHSPHCTESQNATGYKNGYGGDYTSLGRQWFTLKTQLRRGRCHGRGHSRCSEGLLSGRLGRFLCRRGDRKEYGHVDSCIRTTPSCGVAFNRCSIGCDGKPGQRRRSPHLCALIQPYTCRLKRVSLGWTSLCIIQWQGDGHRRGEVRQQRVTGLYLQTRHRGILCNESADATLGPMNQHTKKKHVLYM